MITIINVTPLESIREQQTLPDIQEEISRMGFTAAISVAPWDKTVITVTGHGHTVTRGWRHPMKDQLPALVRLRVWKQTLALLRDLTA